jgi:DNA-binding NarL/FixJ family response regulator
MLEGLATLDQLGAAGDLAWVRQLQRHHGVSVASTYRGGRKGYGNNLSPQESKVAWQASLGKTNAEIATAVNLAVKTVEHHLARAMRKLGVTSRVSLVRACLSDPDATGAEFAPSEEADRPRTR